MAEPSVLGEQLRRYRVAAGLTQEELAERAGVSARAVSDLERGVIQTPRKDTLNLIAEALALVTEDRAAFIGLRRPGGAVDVAAAPAAAAPALLPAPGGAALPTGMLTFLIADVRGYTAYTHRHGDEAGARLATHFAALSGEVVMGEGGQVVEVRGDEVLAVFTSARKALRAAVDLVTRCAVEATAEVPLRAGVGLDVGEPVSVPGGYRGEVINVAARLCAQAGPGEVLASDAVVSLARRVEGLAYEERGELQLKGLSRPIRAWLVRAGEELPLVSEAAAPAAPRAISAAPRHNLPVALSSFIGREQEQVQVRALLQGARLVTLTGAGGAGKTRLSLQVAGELLDEYPEGVWLVELAPLADPALAVPAVAAALGLREEAGQPLLGTLLGYLAARSRTLLVLDNCEHLVAACAELAAVLLRGCPHLRLLASSREGLGVPGERLYRVPSLATPTPGQLPAPEKLGGYAAVALFTARAQERRPDFVLTTGNALAVAQICARLDGMPLAIELAAARVGSLPVEAIAARLDDRFRLLTGGPRTAVPRQQTLRATLNWSHDLLTESEQLLLHRLSVFAGGWTLEAAEAVCAGPGVETWEVLDLLGGLVNKSLVLLDEAGPNGEHERYRLLETVRQYAHEHLVAAREAAVRERHLHWYLALAEAADAALTGPPAAAWLARLEREHDNLRAALAWSLQEGSAGETGLRLAYALWRFWDMHGHLSEGRRWLAQSLAAGAVGTATLRAGALRGAGNLAMAQGDYPEARTLYEESLVLCRELGDKQGSGYALMNLGMVASWQEDFPAARVCSDEALTLFRELGDTYGIGAALSGLGAVASWQGDYPAAWALLVEGLALLRQLGDKRQIGAALICLGLVALHQGDYPAARAQHEESLALSRELEDKRDIGLARMYLGLGALYRGDFPPAQALLEESLALFRELEDQWGTDTTLTLLGNLALAKGEYPVARARHEESLARCRELVDRLGIAEALNGLGTGACRQGDYRRAGGLYAESLTLCRTVGDTRLSAEVLEGLAGVAAAQGQAHTAAQLLGATDTLRAATAAPVPPPRRADYDRTVAAARAALGEDAFAVAWAAGQALPLAQATALALEAGLSG